MGVCRSCGQEIEWRTTKNGKNIPVNVVKFYGLSLQEAHRRGLAADSATRRALVTDDGRVVQAIQVHAETEGRFVGQESHFSTCPQADQHRRR